MKFYWNTRTIVKEGPETFHRQDEVEKGHLLGSELTLHPSPGFKGSNGEHISRVLQA